MLRPDGEGFAAGLDLRPHGDSSPDGDAEWWVLSDLDVARQGRDHVAGVGAASPTVAPSVVLESWAEPGDDGWAGIGTAVARLDGPRWRHEVDGPAAALLAGCRGAPPLAELIELLALAHDRPADALVAATLPAVREFVRHGILRPTRGVERLRAGHPRLAEEALRPRGDAGT